LVREWHSSHPRHGWAIGRYVIMPDHLHFFCAPELDAKPLPVFIGFWKEWTSKGIKQSLRMATSLEGRGQRPRLQQCPRLQRM
jgi:putative transposase